MIVTHFQRRFVRTVYRNYPPAIPTLQPAIHCYQCQRPQWQTTLRRNQFIHRSAPTPAELLRTSIQEVLVGNWIRLHGRAGLYCVNTTTWMVIIHMRTKGNLFYSILIELSIRTDSKASILTIFAIRAWAFNPKTRSLPLTESSLPAPGVTD